MTDDETTPTDEPAEPAAPELASADPVPDEPEAPAPAGADDKETNE